MTLHDWYHWRAMFYCVCVSLILMVGVVAIRQGGRKPVSGEAVPPDAADGERRPISRTVLNRPCKLDNGVYRLGNTDPATVYVIETAEGLAMIDAGLEAEHEKIVAALKQLGLEPSRLKLILLTHAHGDHTMGAERFRQETGAKVCIGREDAVVLRRGSPWEAIFSRFGMPGVRVHPTTVDVDLADGRVLTLGEARISAIATPGHTPGSFCYLIEHRGRRLLFTGDTIMSLADGLGTYSAYLPPRYGGNAQDYLDSLKKLRLMPAPDLLLPGHAGSDLLVQDPRLTNEMWLALLDRGIAELETLLERYRRDGADFLDGVPKALDAGLFYLGDLQGQAVYAVVNPSSTVLFDGCGDGALEFIAAAWEQLGIAPPPLKCILLTSCYADRLGG